MVIKLTNYIKYSVIITGHMDFIYSDVYLKWLSQQKLNLSHTTQVS